MARPRDLRSGTDGCTRLVQNLLERFDALLCRAVNGTDYVEQRLFDRRQDGAIAGRFSPMKCFKEVEQEAEPVTQPIIFQRVGQAVFGLMARGAARFPKLKTRNDERSSLDRSEKPSAIKSKFAIIQSDAHSRQRLVD